MSPKVEPARITKLVPRRRFSAASAGGPSPSTLAKEALATWKFSPSNLAADARKCVRSRGCSWIGNSKPLSDSSYTLGCKPNLKMAALQLGQCREWSPQMVEHILGSQPTRFYRSATRRIRKAQVVSLSPYGARFILLLLQFLPFLLAGEHSRDLDKCRVDSGKSQVFDAFLETLHALADTKLLTARFKDSCCQPPNHANEAGGLERIRVSLTSERNSSSVVNRATAGAPAGRTQLLSVLSVFLETQNPHAVPEELTVSLEKSRASNKQSSCAA